MAKEKECVVETRKLPAQDDRVETGPVQFGEDWPGFFIRGDNVFAIRLAIANILVSPNDILARMQLRGFMEELDSCNVNKGLVKEMYAREDGKV
jgi:hypothetical protein